jgi:hypothetical protein
VRHWERLADADGAHRDEEQTHAARHAGLVTIDGVTHLSGLLGGAQGAIVTEVFEAYVRAEFDAEWDDVRARYGDAACPSLMERTERQRRADALVAIFEAAAGGGHGPRVPVVDILIDQHVYEAQLVAMVEDRALAVDVVDPTRSRCHTRRGDPIGPADAVAASLVGHVRRVVLGADGVIINLGRSSRLFHGSARTAAILQAALSHAGRCVWPGCIHRRCQIDHTRAWATDEGTTDVANSGPLCPRHNRQPPRGQSRSPSVGTPARARRCTPLPVRAP